MGMESAGLVRLDPDPEEQPDYSEFDKFGVMIEVKFRNNEELQELNAQRQSGGERSVSTMLYLMAMQVRLYDDLTSVLTRMLHMLLSADMHVLLGADMHVACARHACRMCQTCMSHVPRGTSTCNSRW
jgi:hypothetical protein